MEILFVLVPLSIALITLAVYIFRWAVKSGQYDDLQGPAHSILFDDDEHLIPKNDANATESATLEGKGGAPANQDQDQNQGHKGQSAPKTQVTPSQTNSQS